MKSDKINSQFTYLCPTRILENLLLGRVVSSQPFREFLTNARLSYCSLFTQRRQFWNRKHCFRRLIVADDSLLQWILSSLKARTRSLTIFYSNNMKLCFVQLKQAIASCFETSILLWFKIIIRLKILVFIILKFIVCICFHKIHEFVTNNTWTRKLSKILSII